MLFRSQQICCKPYEEFDEDGNYVGPSHFNDAENECDQTFTWNRYTTINGGFGGIIGPGTCNCPTVKLDAIDSDCFTSYACQACFVFPFTGYTGTANTIVTPTTLAFPPVYNRPTHCRTSAMTRAVACSGAIEVEVCLPFSSTYITMTVV